MTVHDPHPDTHQFGLYDSCPRCQEHASHPFESLDTENIHRLLTGQVYTDLDRQALNVMEASVRNAKEVIRRVLG